MLKPVVFLLASAVFVSAQTVTSIEFRTDPADRVIRPLETMSVQVRVMGKLSEQTGRVRTQDWSARVVEPGGGWVSKPFLWQGSEKDTYLQTANSALANILRAGVAQYTIKDSVLYTAPEKPGKYTIEATASGTKSMITVEVKADAASRKKAEKVTFTAEVASTDPYRKLAEYYAPFIAQETWFQPKADIPARFDFDGDWNGDDNWDDMEIGSSQAYVHYAAMETESHWFLIYNVFHPRDYSDNCIVGTCHENDNEGLILTIKKDGTQYGKLQVMETLAHNNIYSYTAESGIRNGVHDIDGPIEFFENSHPMIFIESGGHGITSVSDKHSSFDRSKMEFNSNTGITLFYKGVAERPKHASDRNVGYELLPIYEQWWLKSNTDWKDRTFDAFYSYQPFGGRPAAKQASVSGSFYGRKESENKAKPFWGWHDVRTLKAKVLNVGQWGLDPAYSVQKDLSFPSGQEPALTYIFNPYLGIGDAASMARLAAAAAAVVKPTVAAVTGIQTPAATAVLTPPAPTALAEAPEGTCDITATVDGTVTAVIHGSTVEYTIQAGAPVKDSAVQCTASIPAQSMATLDVEKKAGRGNVKVVTKPSLANGYEIGVQIEDSKGGADRYQLRLRWKVQ